MKENTLFEGTPYCEEVQKLRTRFFEDKEAPRNMTLEEIMMMVHNKPCRRINPRSSVAKKFQRGSKLIYGSEVVLILEREDNTLDFQCHTAKYSGPRGKLFAGILPGSVFYTLGGVRVTIEEAQMVTRLRNVIRECVEILPRYEPGTSAEGPEDRREGLVDLRCSEYSRLAAYKHVISAAPVVL